MYSICYTTAIQRRIRVPTATRHHHATGIDETAEWCNSFVSVQKPNGKVRLCLDPARLNQELIRLVHMEPILNEIFPKLNNVQYLSLIDASSWVPQHETRQEIIIPHHICMPIW